MPPPAQLSKTPMTPGHSLTIQALMAGEIIVHCFIPEMDILKRWFEPFRPQSHARPTRNCAMKTAMSSCFTTIPNAPKQHWTSWPNTNSPAPSPSNFPKERANPAKTWPTSGQRQRPTYRFYAHMNKNQKRLRMIS